MDSAGQPARPGRDPHVPGPRPDHPPTGATGSVPPPPDHAPSAGRPTKPSPAPPAPAPATSVPVDEEPPSAALPAGAPATPPAEPSADAPNASHNTPTSSSDDELMVVDESPAAALRAAVAVVPGVVAVGEPASRAMGKLRSAIGAGNEAGVSLTEGTEQVAVDLSIVCAIDRPLRETAQEVQEAAFGSLAGEARSVVEVNVEVIDASASPGALALGPEATRRAPSPSAIPGHIRVSSKALRTVATHLASARFGVPERRIGVSLNDEASELALHLALPLPVEPLTVPSSSGPSLRERALGLRAPLRADFARLTGTALSRVDVRVSGTLEPESAGEL